MRVFQITGRQFRPRLTAISIAVLATLSSTLGAEDPLRLIPAGAATIVVFRNLDATCKNVNQYLTQAFPESHQIEPKDIEAGLDLPPGTIDLSKPLLIIGTQGGLQPDDLILGFVPKPGSPLRSKP